MKFVLFVPLVLWLCGCAGTPGYVSKTESLLDGERQVQVEPGWLYGGGLNTSPVKLGGLWTEKAPEQFVLNIVLAGGEAIRSVKVGIDGTTTEFHQAPSGQFVLPITFVQDMVSAKRCIVQVVTPRSKLEGIFSFDQQTYARPAFKKALQQIRGSAAAGPRRP
jgi:hypothetical protein